MKKKNKQMLGNMELSAFCDQLSMIVSLDCHFMRELVFYRRMLRMRRPEKFWRVSVIL